MMPEATPTRKTRRQRKAKPSTGPTCVRCGERHLQNPVHSIFGALGTTCETHVAGALLTLQQNGLIELATTGEIRIQAVQQPDGFWRVTGEQLAPYYDRAHRLSLDLARKIDVTTKEIVLTLSAKSVRRLLNRGTNREDVKAAAA
ncbi:hypothetical protein GO986_17810 [Deinococcus sp. HMF7620]|uniref:Uncharacterized protein n=1 Tax=Deinococcus arboris TaxID=2682977 RepID=A0A7C9I1F7_9DEIO|nr:hypothetical protein [Deinococcus arboris]MVN88595.1 hypothetical protein [Deinococcus arboris]